MDNHPTEAGEKVEMGGRVKMDGRGEVTIKLCRFNADKNATPSPSQVPGNHVSLMS